MDKAQSPTAAQIEGVREVYAGINRNDIEAAIRILDDDIAWFEPEEYGKSCRGREAVAAHLKVARARWAEGACAAEVTVSGDRIVVFVDVHVRLKDEAEFREGRHAAVYTFRNGKAIEMRIFDDTDQALAFSLRINKQ